MASCGSRAPVKPCAPQAPYPGTPRRFPSSLSRCYPASHEYRFDLALSGDSSTFQSPGMARGVVLSAIAEPPVLGGAGDGAVREFGRDSILDIVETRLTSDGRWPGPAEPVLALDW